MNSEVSPTTSPMASSMGPSSSATRAAMASSGVTEASSTIVSPVGIDHVARIVEGHFEMAEVFRIGARLHDRHERHRGWRSRWDRPRRGPDRRRQVGVRMAAHDHVQAGHGLGDADVGGQAHMGQAMMMSTPSAVSASTSSCIASISSWKTRCRRARRFRMRVRGQRRDDADLNAVHVEHQRVADTAVQRGSPLTSRLPETTGNRSPRPGAG
jgi:hypothetical protein